MIIKQFKLKYRNDVDYKAFNFDDHMMMFKSEKNSQGKTTFLRGLLYSLGFNVPNTKNVKFEKYDFQTLVITNNHKELLISRSDSIIRINDQFYSYPDDYNRVISTIFGAVNLDLINNLLGVIYLDQEKGWTLLNRGTIIGKNGFRIESFLRGLNDTDANVTVEKISTLNDEIAKYRLMKNISDYQNSLIEKSQPLRTDLYDEELEIKISLITNKINNLTTKINELQRAKKSSVDFINYIDSLGLQVKINGDIHIIRKKDLVDWKDILGISDMEISNLLIDREILKKEKSELISQRKQNALFEIDTVLQSFDKTLSNINIDSIQIEKIIEGLEKNRTDLKNQLKEITLHQNPYINFINEHIQKYWNDFEIEIEYKEDYLFTDDLKSLSGAILYKMIISFKLSYILALQNKLEYKLPIFIDSPNGREVEKKTVEKVMEIIQRDFNDNQVFICSIFDFESMDITDNQKLIFDNLRAFDRKNLFD